MKSRPIRPWHRLFFRLSSPYRYHINEALKAAMHRGVGIGMRERLRTLVSLFCDQCGEPAAYPDARFCAMCGVPLQRTERIALQVPSSALAPSTAREDEPTLRLPKPPGTLMHDWRKGHPDKLLDTQGYEAIRLKNALHKIESRQS